MARPVLHFKLHLKTAFVVALLHHYPPPFVVLTRILNAIFLKGKLNSMKKITMIIAFFLISHQLLAQDCTHYMYMQKNKSIEMTSFNDKGDITFKTVSKVSNVNTENGVTTATVVADAYDKSGKLINSSNFTYKCDGGVMMMDMSLNSPQQSDQKTKVAIKIINKSFTEYPGAMKVGDHLKNASTQMESTMSNGMTAVTIIQVTDRIVIGKLNNFSTHLDVNISSKFSITDCSNRAFQAVFCACKQLQILQTFGRSFIFLCLLLR